MKQLIIVASCLGLGILIGLQIPSGRNLISTNPPGSAGGILGNSGKSQTTVAELNQTPFTTVPDGKIQPVHIPAGANAEDYVRIPRTLLKHLKADTINIDSMTFKEPMLTALGLNEAQRTALNKALKEISLEAADFQKRHCVLKRDKEGGQYYEIKPAAEEVTAALKGFEARTRESLAGSDPALASAAYSLLEQSPLLSDFQYASQELAIIDNPGGMGAAGKKNFSIEIKRFDWNGNSAGRTILLATPELLKTRYPFLLGSQSP